MGKILNHIIALAIIFLASCIYSCNTDGCTENQSSIPLAGFYSSENGTAISVSSLEIIGIGAICDSILNNSISAIQQVYLPLRSTQNNTAYRFQYNDSIIYCDTIWFEYNSTPYFASEECGAMYRYTITSTRYTNFFIDSVIVTDPEITNIDVERIKIYFKTN